MHRSFSFFLSGADQEARGRHASKVIIGGIEVEVAGTTVRNSMTWVFAFDVSSGAREKGRRRLRFWLRFSPSKCPVATKISAQPMEMSTKCLAHKH